MPHAPLVKGFRNDQLRFEMQIALGAVAYGLGDVGEITATAERIKDGDYESWFRAWTDTADRVTAIADAAAAGGHRVSAAEAYLRACTYAFAATSSLDGTDDPQRLLPTWRRHRELWHRFCELSDPPIERIAIPYEDIELVGYLFRPRGAPAGRLPTIILNNGSDGPVNSMWAMGGAGAVARGYLAVTFDGPGQGHALYEQGLTFRPDWEKVITPVVDFLLARDDVDPDRLALQGISQGGYWVPRALAFESRVKAGIADPGVMNVAASWEAPLPASLIKALDEGDRERFNRNMRMGMRFSKDNRQTLAFRMRPYGLDDYYEAYQTVRQYRLGDLAKQIRCPMLITDPEDENFWPGQSRQLYDALEVAHKKLVAFPRSEGGSEHCEPTVPRRRDQVVFDWLDEVWAASPTGG